MDKKKTAVLGGSFDPVHLGHLFLLNCAVKYTDYERFLIIPAALSNFKQKSRPCASDTDRLNMLDLALEDFYDIYPENRGADISICTLELSRGGVSYTYDTVLAVKKEYDIRDRLGFIIGDDHIEKLHSWYRFDDLKEEVEFIICRRNPDGTMWEKLPPGTRFVKLEPSDTAPQSATAVRTNVEKYSGYLSKRVWDYVRTGNLYH